MTEPIITAPATKVARNHPRRPKSYSWVGTVTRWLLVALVLVIFAIPHLLSITGRPLIVIDGGSMAPTYQVGDLLITAPPTGDDLQVGAILIVGKPPSAYVHRVVEVVDDETANADGPSTKALLQGDANSTPDLDWVTQEDVTGIPVTHLSGIGTKFLIGMMTPVGNVILALFCIFVIANPLRARE